MIVGRSNVGKSTLFNRLLGRKEAITGEEYALTRDYQSERCILNDIEFYLIDTAGYNTKKSELSKKINLTIKEQIMKADIIFFVVDISTNLTSEDRECWELKTVKNYEHQINDFGIAEFIKITALSKNSTLMIYNLIKDKVSKINKGFNKIENPKFRDNLAQHFKKENQKLFSLLNKLTE